MTHDRFHRKLTRLFIASPESSRRGRRVHRTFEALEDRALLTAALAPLPNIMVPSTLGYQVPLDGSQSGLANQTFAVMSNNPRIKATVATGQFVTLNISHTAANSGDITFSGAVTFQVFQDLTPNTAAEIEQFVTSGFYNGKDFHRVANGFPNSTSYIVQGGSLSGNGTGTSGQPGTPFPDEFNPQLAFTGAYQVAMANAGADTNDTQFFFTTGSPAFLNFGYTIFAQVVAGQNIIQDMTQVELNGTMPVNPITIASASLSNVSPDGVIHIDATGAAPGATATVTVTANDPTTSTIARRSFTVTVGADSNAPERPFVQTISPVANDLDTGLNLTVGQGQTTTFRIPGVSPTPNDTLTYTVQGGVTVNPVTGVKSFISLANATANVDSSTGIVQITPNAGFSGTINVLVGVRDQVNRSGAASLDDPSNYEYHQFTLTVNASSTPALQPPIAIPFAQAITENGFATVQLEGLNTNAGSSPTPTYTITAQPTHGTITQFNATTGTFKYTPTPGFIGTDRLQYTITTTGGGLPSPLTSVASTVTFNIHSDFTISTNPTNGSVVTTLPNGQITVTFSQPIAGLTDGGPGLTAGDPYGIILVPRGPDLAFSAPSGVDGGDLPLHVNTVYHVNGDGTSSITLTPLQPLSADVYLISVDLSKFTDTAGDPLYDPNNGDDTFLFQPSPATSAPLKVTGVTTYNGFTTVNNNAIFQPDTLAIGFNKALYAGAAGGNNVQLLAAPSYTPVSSVAVYSPSNNTIYLTPTTTLQPGITYVIAVSKTVSDDQGYGGPGVPLGQNFYDSFSVLNASVGAGSSPLKVAQNAGGNVQTLPTNGSAWTLPLGYASVQFTELLNVTSGHLGRYSVMLDPRTVGSDSNSALENVPLNAKLAFNPNTDQLIIVPTQPTSNGLYVLGLTNMQAVNGDPLLNSAGQQAGVNGPPVYATFQLQVGSATAAVVSVAAHDMVAKGAVVRPEAVQTQGTQTSKLVQGPQAPSRGQERIRARIVQRDRRIF